MNEVSMAQGNPAGAIEDRLKALGIELPCPPPPAGNYEPVVIRRSVGYVSGQLPIRNGVLAYSGRVGEELSVEEAMQAAELAAINVLAQIECSSNGRHSFAGLLRMEGYIASARGFANQPEILDRASRLFVDVLGKPGAHARAAFSVEQLPLNASVERVVTFAVKPVTETNTPARSASTSPSQARRLAPECPSRLGYEAAGIGPQMAQDLT